MPRGIKYSTEMREELRTKALKLKKEGVTQKDIAQQLNIAMGTLVRLLGKTGPKSKRGARKAPSASAKTDTVTLSTNNPMVQLALAHERLMEINKQLDALNAEKEKLVEKMEAIMNKAAEVCPGLKDPRK